MDGRSRMKGGGINGSYQREGSRLRISPLPRVNVVGRGTNLTALFGNGDIHILNLVGRPKARKYRTLRMDNR